MVKSYGLFIYIPSMKDSEYEMTTSHVDHGTMGNRNGCYGLKCWFLQCPQLEFDGTNIGQ